jgi:hypothetical protein
VALTDYLSRCDSVAILRGIRPNEAIAITAPPESMRPTWARGGRGRVRHRIGGL